MYQWTGTSARESSLFPAIPRKRFVVIYLQSAETDQARGVAEFHEGEVAGFAAALTRAARGARR
jgi:hypothetical protein